MSKAPIRPKIPSAVPNGKLNSAKIKTMIATTRPQLLPYCTARNAKKYNIRKPMDKISMIQTEAAKNNRTALI